MFPRSFEACLTLTLDVLPSECIGYFETASGGTCEDFLTKFGKKTLELKLQKSVFEGHLLLN